MKEELYCEERTLQECEKLKFGVSESNNCILSVFDVKTQNIEEIDLKINKDLNLRGTKCLLPNGSLFYIYGSESYIIDPQYNVKFIKSAMSSQNACSFFHNGSVYLLGGINQNSWRYKINENRWIGLTSFFTKLSPGQVGPVFKNYVFLWSYFANNVYIYDIDTDSYSDLPIPLVSKIATVIVGNESLFIIDQKKYLYESDGNLRKWKNLRKLSNEGCDYVMNSSPLWYQGCVYYANYYGIFKFDIKKKKLKNVKKYNKIK